MRFLGLKALAGVALLSGLTACQNIENESLLSNVGTDPSTYAVDKTPKESDLLLIPDTTTIKDASTKAEMSGTCHISTYPSHMIYAEGRTAVDLNLSGITNAGICKNGRYSLAVNTAGLASGSRITLVLQVTDSSGKVITYKNSTSVTITY